MAPMQRRATYRRRTEPGQSRPSHSERLRAHAVRCAQQADIRALAGEQPVRHHTDDIVDLLLEPRRVGNLQTEQVDDHAAVVFPRTDIC